MEFKKYLTEAESREVSEVADAFTRYILGDRKSAIAQLTKMKEKSLGTSAESDLDLNDYNKQYNELYKKILNAIK